MEKEINVLFACEDNLAKSRVLSAFVKNELKKSGTVNVNVDSAGLSKTDAETDPSTERMLEDHLPDPGKHTARQITVRDIKKFDVILTINPSQSQRLIEAIREQKIGLRKHKIQTANKFAYGVMSKMEDKKGYVMKKTHFMKLKNLSKQIASKLNEMKK